MLDMFKIFPVADGSVIGFKHPGSFHLGNSLFHHFFLQLGKQNDRSSCCMKFRINASQQEIDYLWMLQGF